MALPDPGMTVDTERTALVITDPQNDFLSPSGVAWGVVGESVTVITNAVRSVSTVMPASNWGPTSGDRTD